MGELVPPVHIVAWGHFGPLSVTGTWSANTHPEDAVPYTRDDSISDLIVAAEDRGLEKAIQKILAMQRGVDETNAEFAAKKLPGVCMDHDADDYVVALQKLKSNHHEPTG